MVREDSSSNKKSIVNYKKLLNKREPLDNLILKLVKQGELEIGVVKIKDEN